MSDPLALYPLKSPKSRVRQTAMLAAGAIAMVVILQLTLGPEPSLFTLQLGLSGLALAIPVVFWLMSNKPQAGGGDIALHRDKIEVPTDRGPVTLELDELQMDQTTEHAGLAIGGVTVSRDLETGRKVTLRSPAARVDLDSDRFVDGEHLRLLVEHIQVVSAGGMPDGAPAFFARGFEE